MAGDGRPRFYVYEYALKERDESRVETHTPFSLEGEILEYVWSKSQDGRPIKELPVAVNNHALDASRYVCRWLSKDTPSADQQIAAMKRREELAKARTVAPSSSWGGLVR
jgi:hypothetical protein